MKNNHILVPVIAALISSQFLMSCSGNKVQWSKNELQENTFASSQFINKKEIVEEKTAVLKIEARTFKANSEKENVELASVSKEITVQTKAVDNYTFVKQLSIPTEISGKTQSNVVTKKFSPAGEPFNFKPGNKNQIIAAVLAAVVGTFGIHRFYLAYPMQGLVQLGLTLVGWLTSWLLIGFIPLFIVWVWVLVDLIRIILGKLQPKGGSYTEGQINI